MDWKVRAALAFARWIKPGFRAGLVAEPLLAILRMVHPRRDIAEKNMEIVFPGISAGEKRRLLRESYENMIWTGVEMLAWQRDKSLINKWTVEAEGTGYFDEALAAGRGIVTFSGHIGNWEHAAAWSGYNYHSTGIARHSDDKFQRELINELRTSTGLNIMSKTEPMLRAVELLRHNKILGIISDQHGGNEGLMAPFFGQTTSSAQGAAVFAYLTGAALIPIQDIRIEPFKFRIIISKPIEWQKAADRKTTIYNITLLVNKALEEMVRRAPGQWLWEHRRFREIES